MGDQKLGGIQVEYSSTGIAALNSEFTSIRTNAGEQFGAIKQSGLQAAQALEYGFAAAGAAIVGSLGLATNKAMEFDSGMRDVGTLGVENLGKLKDEVLSFSSAMGEDANESTRLFYDLISAGVPEDSALRQAETFAKAAHAGVGDVNQAMNFGATIVNAYGLEWKETDNIMGSALATIEYGRTNMGQLGDNVGRVAASAKAAGLEWKELTAAYAGTTAAGINTAESTSALKAMLTSIIKPSAEASELAKELGIDWSTSGLKAKGFAGFLAEVEEKTKGNTTQMGTLVGSSEALNAMLALMSDNGAAKYQAALDGMTDGQKTLNEVFNKWATDNPSYELDKLKSSAQEAAIRLGEGLMPVVVDLGESLIPMVKGVTDFVTAHPDFMAAASKIALGLGGVMLATSGASYAFRQFNTILGVGKLALGAIQASQAATTITGVGTAATAAKVPLWGLATAGWAAAAPFIPLALAIAAVTGGLILLGAGLLKVKESKDQLKESTERLVLQQNEYVKMLEAQGVEIDRALLKEMDFDQQREYLAAKERERDTENLRAFMATKMSAQEVELNYYVARNLMLNENLSMEEAAKLSMMNLTQAELLAILHADAVKTQSTLESLGIRSAATAAATESMSASNQQAADSARQMVTQIDDNMKWWIANNLQLLAKNQSVWNQLSADQQAWAQEYADSLHSQAAVTEETTMEARFHLDEFGNLVGKELPTAVADGTGKSAEALSRMKEVAKIGGYEMEATLINVSKAAEQMAERLAQSSMDGAQEYAKAMKIVEEATADAYFAMEKLDLDRRWSPSINDRIAASLENTVGIYGAGFGKVRALAQATHEILAMPIQSNVDIAANQIASTALAGEFGPVAQNAVGGTLDPVVPRPSPAAGITGIGAAKGERPIVVNIHDPVIERDADFETLGIEFARHLQLKLISQSTG